MKASLSIVQMGMVAVWFGTLLGCGPAGDSNADEAAPARGEQAARTAPPEEQLPSLWTRTKGSDWPSFLGPTGDSKSSETGLIVPWPAEGPRIVWQMEVGSGYGIGSIAAGRYFHFDRRDERPGRGQARVACYRAETGEPLWSFEYRSEYEDLLGYNNGPRSSPVVDGNRVYALGVEGMLHCLRATDGEVLWKVDLSAKYHVVQNFFGVGTTPAIFEDLLIVMVGGSPPNSPSLYASNGQVDGNGTGIVAFDKFTGEVRYEITDELASYASTKLAKIDGRDWCFQLCRGGLVAFHPRTGQVDFQYPWRAELLESVNASTPVVVEDEVFISETYQIGSSLLKVAPGAYDVVWKDERRSRDKSFRAHWGTPIHVDGFLYGASGRNAPDADLRCIRWSTGEVAWREETHDRSSLLYVDGHFINLGEYGVLQLLKVNPEKREVVSEVILRRDEPGTDPIDGGKPRLLRAPCWAAPILAHGLLFVRGDDRVVCLEVIKD